MENKKVSLSDFLIVLAIIIVLVVFIISLGKINPTGISKMPQTFRDNVDEAKRKHKRLEDHLKKQKTLKQKLNKKFKRIYFGVRFSLILIWGGFMSILYIINLINDLGDFLDYSEASLLLGVILNFLTFGTLTNLNNFLDLIKIKTENWIYGKYVQLDDRIELNQNNLIDLESKISANTNIQIS